MTPNLWVVDASFSGALLLPDEHSELALELVASTRNGKTELHTTSLWRHEMANMLVSAVRRKRLAAAQLPTAWALVDALPISVSRDEKGAQWPKLATLAVESGLTAYDAGYLALALSLHAGLATDDAELRKAAKQRRVPLWGER